MTQLDGTNRVKTKQDLLQVRVTNDELQKIDRAAEQVGETRSEFVRAVLLDIAKLTTDGSED